MPEAIAARCGNTNDRIDFVLKTFGVPAPKLIADVSPKVSDVMQRKILSVHPDATAAEALQLMVEKNLRILPVMDDEQKCRGLLSLFKLSKFLFPAANREHNSREVLSSLSNLARTLDGELALGLTTRARRLAFTNCAMWSHARNNCCPTHALPTRSRKGHCETDKLDMLLAINESLTIL